jgi:hypothetical protein
MLGIITSPPEPLQWAVAVLHLELPHTEELLLLNRTWSAPSRLCPWPRTLTDHQTHTSHRGKSQPILGREGNREWINQENIDRMWRCQRLEDFTCCIDGVQMVYTHPQKMKNFWLLVINFLNFCFNFFYNLNFFVLFHYLTVSSFWAVILQHTCTLQFLM